MRFRSVFLVLLFLPFFLTANAAPLLVVVLMVKNEAPVMKATLTPFLNAGHKHFMIYDTGSTDDTVKIAKNLFEQHAITDFVVLQEPFVDFSTSRNRALDVTEANFPQATFMLMLDAEWELVNYHGLINFCLQQKDANRSYHIRIINDLCDYYVGRLIRCGTKKRFVGSVHEELTGVEASVPRDIYFLWKKTDYGQAKTEKRFHRDIEMLMRDFHKDPTNGRTVFYLGQTYSCLGDWQKARQWYEHRLLMGGWQEELFLASYRLGLIYNMMGDWNRALSQLLQAYSIQPARAEPLICIAQRYKELGNKKLCELFARASLKIPYPEFNTLATEKDMYLKERHDLLAWAMS